ncbi:type VI secretion protein [Burkholderia sp. ABCPW 14]|uniref:TagK domain-containing protein n=1 Tax=Burkholderia sp. ABCPW 14 TaxID=1637860 RepID=UPI000770E22C|nr:TagK domain-containing protein [Burkholderia sp. ABCPW 14]KVD77279.1 type VI secretion protein [Burkholderia sp. ABCPW 14]
MRTFKLFRRSKPDMKYAEATPRRADASPAAACDADAPVMETLLTGSPEAGMRDAMRDGNAVFGLIGTAISAETFARRQGEHATDGAMASGSPIQARDLMHSLYEQYCGALEDPQASLASDWPAQMAIVRRPPPDQPGDRRKGSEAAEEADSIDALVSGSSVFDDVFGLLRPGDTPDPAAMEPIPEVLRLFAPAEYHAAMARRPGSLPPALARREHQTLAIDSPLSASGSTSSHDAS